MTTTHASLTDRYVTAVLTGVREDQQAEVEAQLRGAIGEEIETGVAAIATRPTPTLPLGPHITLQIRSPPSKSMMGLTSERVCS